MQTLFLNAPYLGKVELCKETLDYLKKKSYQTVGLYASVQFVNQLDNVKKQLETENISVISSKADRADAFGQILGCDNFHNSLNLTKTEKEKIDCYLYIGDGKFHPLALLYGPKEEQRIEEIVCNDPLARRMILITSDDIRTTLRKYKSFLMKFLSAQIIGVITTIKPGQEQFKPALLLEKKYPSKKFYHFIDNDISFHQLENFPFIQVWVNTACPRIGFDDQEKFNKGVINLNDALEAEKILGRQ